MKLEIKEWLKKNLTCPRHGIHVSIDGAAVCCPRGCSYPVVDGIPVMLLGEVPPTHDAMRKSLAEASDKDHLIAAENSSADQNRDRIDPHVQAVVSATCGILYKDLVGKLQRYPIPNLRLPVGNNRLFLDVGCNWGRWCVAAANKGYRSIGLDPDLGAILAARKVARRMNASAAFVVADARHIPFAEAAIDVVFSYSVLQHFAKPDARQALAEFARVTKPSGTALVQMPNAFGFRSLYHQLRRGFRQARHFEVRYWTPRELLRCFNAELGPTHLSVDGFFGLGIQPSDIDLLPIRYRTVVRCSEMLRSMSKFVPGLSWFADSLYARSTRATRTPLRSVDAATTT